MQRCSDPVWASRAVFSNYLFNEYTSKQLLYINYLYKNTYIQIHVCKYTEFQGKYLQEKLFAQT